MSENTQPIVIPNDTIDREDVAMRNRYLQVLIQTGDLNDIQRAQMSGLLATLQRLIVSDVDADGNIDVGWIDWAAIRQQQETLVELVEARKLGGPISAPRLFTITTTIDDLLDSAADVVGDERIFGFVASPIIDDEKDIKKSE